MINEFIDANKKLEEENKLLQLQVKDHKMLCSKYQEKVADLMSQKNEEMNQHQVTVKSLKNEVKEREQNFREVQRLENQLSDIQNKFSKLQQILELKETQLQNSEKEKDELKAKNNNLLQKNAKLDNQIEDLFQKNSKLEDEASNYQSALGVATNFQLGDGDQNNAVNLNNDILNLNDKIKKYITNLKQDVVVNMEEVKKLLLRYECTTKITSQKDNRPLLHAVLQRHVMETILEYANLYFQSTGKHYHLEADIVKNESTLSLLLSHTSKCRIGDDDITRVGPSKLRQQIYSILSNRGFGDIIGTGNTTHEHPFINFYKEQLNNIMNRLRMIRDNQKKTASDNLAATIIREVIKIFWFRLKVQEPVVQFQWIANNSKVDKTYMEGNNLDEYENSYVDLCYFPLIGRDFGTNIQKLYTLAKVTTRPRA